MQAKSLAKRERADDDVAKPDGNVTIALIIGTQYLTFSVEAPALIYRALGI
jgi:hypothetical protein